MDKPQSNFQHFVSQLSAVARTALAVVAAVTLAVILAVLYVTCGTRLTVSRTNSTSLSPTQIQSIRSIGQWEFLSIADEELIDTVRYGFFGDDYLARIYYGTLRLGIDLSNADEQWIRAKGDSVTVTLPPITLLDENFIDEARTRSFYESGKWTHADREQMYLRAVATMKQRCLNPANVHTATQNAEQQMINFFRSMGFERVKIEIRPD